MFGCNRGAAQHTTTLTKKNSTNGLSYSTSVQQHVKALEPFLVFPIAHIISVQYKEKVDTIQKNLSAPEPTSSSTSTTTPGKLLQ